MEILNHLGHGLSQKGVFSKRQVNVLGVFFENVLLLKKHLWKNTFGTFPALLPPTSTHYTFLNLLMPPSYF